MVSTSFNGDEPLRDSEVNDGVRSGSDPSLTEVSREGVNVDPLEANGWYTDTMESAVPPEVAEQVEEEEPVQESVFWRGVNWVRNMFSRTPSSIQSEDVAAQAIDKGVESTCSDVMQEQFAEISEVAKQDYNETKDPLSKEIVDITTELNEELSKDEFDWKQINLLLRKLAIVLGSKMLQNDHEVSLEELQRMKDDIEKVQKTYNTKWELAFGITLGAISIAAGLVGLGGGIGGATGALSTAFLKPIEAITSGANAVSQGGQNFSKFISNSNESKRALYQFMLEHDRNAKNTFDTAKGDTTQKINQMISQASSENDRYYQAFLKILQ
ncbi:MAG: hypothetical protein VX777_02095 [Chlamydiota bacterium]|nr:hypothetical protein [Chlamydiota bacterium]